MISVDYEALTVEGDFKARFNSKDEMFKAIAKYVVAAGKDIPRKVRAGKVEDNRPYIFKGQTK